MTGLQKFSTLMGIACLLLPAMLWASDEVELTQAELIEVLHENGGSTHRLRYMDGSVFDARVDDVLEDMEDLCNVYLAQAQIPHPENIIVSMSDRFIPFGVTDADATQFFEAYTVENATCMWGDF
ncbi:DUF6497 family protein [Cochlodiniinecator piscidefendens]|uniref:DUF6497 family protein n=1 Tax=Cochlodiniinecator piscidefendens TaxID=2715756 RepID=UPI001409A429|nr:DUF6497 family protein [Cochlodiniinecator piscidefendens]